MGDDKVDRGTDSSKSAAEDLSEIIPPDSPLESYMRWATEAHGAPAIYHLACVLAVLTHELARRGFKLRTSHPMGLWFALVGESAIGKSSAITMAEQFIRDAWKNAGLELDPDPWLEAEGSIAGLLSALQERFDPSRGTTTAILFQHEAASLFATREPISEMLCRLADGQSYQRNLRELQKKRDRPDSIEQPVLSALYATTESALAPHFTEAQRSGGIYSRLAWLKPTFSPGRLRLEGVDTRKAEGLRILALESWVAWFAQIQLAFDGELLIETSPEAHALLERELFEPVRLTLRESDDNNGVKLRTVDRTRVVAAVLASQRLSRVVEPQDMQRAVHFGKILLVHAERITLGSADIYRLSKRVEHIIRTQADEGATARILYARCKTASRELHAALGQLMEQGRVFEDTGIDGVKRFYHSKTTRGGQLASDAGRRAGQVFNLTRKPN